MINSRISDELLAAGEWLDSPDIGTPKSNGTARIVGAIPSIEGANELAPPFERTIDLLSGDGAFTDSAHAQRLYDIHGKQVRYVEDWRHWIVWDGQRWARDREGIRIAELAKDVGISLLKDAATAGASTTRAQALAKAGRDALSAGRIASMCQLARGIRGVAVQVDQLDAQAWKLGVQNGVVDLKTGTLRAGDPADLMTLQSSTAFDPDALCPRWEAAMEQWFPDVEVRAYVQRLSGAMLVGQQRDHVFVIHIGVGRNGKGTFVRSLEHTLGTDYTTTPSMSLLVESKYDEHPTVIAQLRGKRLAVAAETKQRATLSEASVKTLTGGDRLNARGMHENPYTFAPTHSLWLQTNHLPAIRGRDRGIWSRIKVVEWVSTFTPGSTDDPGLGDALAKEAPGILAWMVRGCLDWQEWGLNEPEAVIRATLAYRNAEDVMGRFVKDTGIVFAKGVKTPLASMVDAFKTWCEQNGARPAVADLKAYLDDEGVTRTQGKDLGTPKRVWMLVNVGMAE